MHELSFGKLGHSALTKKLNHSNLSSSLGAMNLRKREDFMAHVVYTFWGWFVEVSSLHNMVDSKRARISAKAENF